MKRADFGIQSWVDHTVMSESIFLRVRVECFHRNIVLDNITIIQDLLHRMDGFQTLLSVQEAPIHFSLKDPLLLNRVDHLSYHERSLLSK